MEVSTHPCVGQSFHDMLGFLWLHLNNTFKIACELQLDSHHIYPNLVSVVSESLFFIFSIIQEQNHTSGLLGVLFLVFPLARC